MRLLRLLIGLCLLSPALPLAAQTVVHRCVGSNGVPVFTDRACSDLDATALQRAAAPRGGSPPPSGAPPPILCAANVAELRQAVVDAFAIGDANRLAGLMLWNGEGHGAAVADIRSLHALMQHPLVEVGTDVPDARDAPATSATTANPNAPVEPAPAHASALLVRTAASDGSSVPRETRFALARQSGCVWLRQP
jgi:hypothetical protein